MLLSLCPESFGIFYIYIVKREPAVWILEGQFIFLFSMENVIFDQNGDKFPHRFQEKQ